MKNSNHSGSGNQTFKPEVRASLDSMKMEMARELGIDLRQIHKGDLPSRVAGQMVKHMIQKQEEAMSGRGERPLQ